MAVLLRFTSVEYRQIELSVACGFIFCDQNQLSSRSIQPSVTDEVYSLVMTPFCTRQVYFIIFIVKYKV